tara:strand:+ start:364 stop:1929 length:1566 start_codon:yes stop_codon:yes gene_type:complete
MAKELRVIGPPGTGKTTTIRQRVERMVNENEYAPEDIVLTSFSRAASNELAGAVKVPPANVSTLHSLARRTMGQKPIAEVGDLAKDWNASGIPSEWAIAGVGGVDLEDGLVLTGNSRYLSDYSLARSRMLPDEHPEWARLARFEEAWLAFKLDTGSEDFTDMLVNATIDAQGGGACAGEPPVIMVDEAQDMSPLSWALVRAWADHPSCEKFYVMGDPAQAIFTFAGADPDQLLVSLPDDQQHILGQSYRMPRLIQRRAEDWLSAHSGTISGGRTYEARDAEGVVRHLPATWRAPDLVVNECQRLAAEGRTSLILATCAYMLGPTLQVLRERGLLFENKWRRTNHVWNPISSVSDTSTRTADRVVAFTHGTHPSLWLPMLSAGAFVARGGKKHAVENPEDWEQWLAPQSLQALAAKDTRWLAANVTKNYQRSVEYAGNILQRQGAEVLDAPIMISIGTIHSVKGGEADVVYVFPDVSNAGSEEMETLAGRDAAIRLGYVAMTRAREELVLCEPIGINELGIG